MLEQDGEPLDHAARGRLGGLKGGKARAEKLEPAERRAIARKAARSRWSKRLERLAEAAKARDEL